MKDRHGNEWVLVPVKATDQMTAAAYPVARMSARGAINHAIAAAPKFEAPEVDDAMCESAYFRACAISDEAGGSSIEIGDGDAGEARIWLSAWQLELGPTLGLVEIRKPTAEDYIAISEKYADIRREQVGTLVHASVSAGMMREGRDIYQATRAVMWPKVGGEL